jgi:hypothetical protein
MSFIQVRPVLALRIGITGARSLENTQLPRLRAQLNALLLAAQQKIGELAERNPRVAAAYRHDLGEAPRPLLRFVSPLARGADRLAAQQALALGYSLHVPMPFPQAEYERDFDTPEDLAEFRDLLARAGDDWLALDGDHGPEMNRAYEAVGRYVVRHCDLLIAIWDGGPSGGRGGTADIVRYAAVSGVPVWWLHATEEHAPVWIGDIQDLRDPRPDSLSPEQQLAMYLETRINPAPPVRRHGRGIVGALAGVGQRHEVLPEAKYFTEPEREDKRRWPWRAYSKMIQWTSGLDPPWLPAQPPTDPVARYWFDRYAPADSDAGDYAARYRSAYVWVFLWGTLALACGALSLLFSLLHPAAAWLRTALETCALAFAIAEFITLVIILALIVFGMRQAWHEHFIEYRLLAELCRKQQALAPLGWTLPIVAVRGVTAADRAAWVAWLFAAEQRAAPSPRGELAHAARGAPRTAVLHDLIAEQQRYHAARGKMAEVASHKLERLGESLFVAVLVCVVLKLLLGHVFGAPGWAVLFAFLATVLPGVSAAFVGIRAYAELQLLAEQSHHMAAELERAHRRMERLNPQRTLVSQDIGAEAALVATLMLQDLDGWARLFRVKAMEPA